MQQLTCYLWFAACLKGFPIGKISKLDIDKERQFNLSIKYSTYINPTCNSLALL